MMGPEMRELAGDYVLGLLEGAERAAFEAELQRDPTLAHLVDRLALQMQALDDTASGPVDPALWDSIEARLDEPAQAGPAGPAANDNAGAGFGRWLSLAASVIVGLGVGYMASALNRPDPPQPRVIAVLLDASDSSPAAIIEAFGDDSVHLVALEDFEVPEGSVLQVWTKPDENIGPVSLGTLANARDVLLRGPELPLPVDGQLYEITLEPSPGSPTGRPTGPILVKGFAKAPI